VYDTTSQTFKFYTNGVLSASVSLDNAPPAYLNGSHLGAWFGLDQNLYRFLDGDIDEVAVYATALSAARIAAHYQAAIPPFLIETPVGPQIQLDWVAPGFILQQNTNLATPLSWSDIPNATNSPVMVAPGAAQL